VFHESGGWRSPVLFRVPFVRPQTKEEVASTLDAVQNIQTTSQALQKSREIYNAKTVEQERLRKEGATQRDVDKVGGHIGTHTHTHTHSHGTVIRHDEVP